MTVQTLALGLLGRLVAWSLGPLRCLGCLVSHYSTRVFEQNALFIIP